jgi:hypothetical protein
MKQIPLTKGQSSVVDDEDYLELAAYRWYCTSNGYAARAEKIDGKYRMILMHRLLLNAPLHCQCDHRDGNKLNNTRQNLRLATPQQNVTNRAKTRLNTSGYKGVTAFSNRWQAKIGVDGKTIHLAYHDTALAASIVYDHAARRFFGEFARLNHPDLPPDPDYEYLLDLILAHQKPPKRKYRERVKKAKSQYRGVYWERSRWRASISVCGRKRHCGYFKDEEAAAHAYDEVARKYRGSKAKLNFAP